MYNTFILNFSPFMTDPTPTRLVEYVRSHAMTYQYLVPFSGAIIIKSSSNLGEMVESYTAFLRPNYFLLSHVNPAYVNGFLQSRYWDWLNSPNPPALEDQRS